MELDGLETEALEAQRYGGAIPRKDETPIVELFHTMERVNAHYYGSKIIIPKDSILKISRSIKNPERANIIACLKDAIGKFINQFDTETVEVSEPFSDHTQAGLPLYQGMHDEKDHYIRTVMFSEPWRPEEHCHRFTVRKINEEMAALKRLLAEKMAAAESLDDMVK